MTDYGIGCIWTMYNILWMALILWLESFYPFLTDWIWLKWPRCKYTTFSKTMVQKWLWLAYRICFHTCQFKTNKCACIWTFIHSLFAKINFIIKLLYSICMARFRALFWWGCWGYTLSWCCTQWLCLFVLFQIKYQRSCPIRIFSRTLWGHLTLFIFIK